MKHADLPERWKRKLAVWNSKFGHQEGIELSAMDFSMGHAIRILFDDESEALFRHAIVIEAPDLDEIGVFTDHCGYHIFSLGGTHVARIER